MDKIKKLFKSGIDEQTYKDLGEKNKEMLNAIATSTTQPDCKTLGRYIGNLIGSLDEKKSKLRKFIGGLFHRTTGITGFRVAVEKLEKLDINIISFLFRLKESARDCRGVVAKAIGGTQHLYPALETLAKLYKKDVYENLIKTVSAMSICTDANQGTGGKAEELFVTTLKYWTEDVCSDMEAENNEYKKYKKNILLNVQTDIKNAGDKVGENRNSDKTVTDTLKKAEKTISDKWQDFISQGYKTGLNEVNSMATIVEKAEEKKEQKDSKK